MIGQGGVTEFATQHSTAIKPGDVCDSGGAILSTDPAIKWTGGKIWVTLQQAEIATRYNWVVTALDIERGLCLIHREITEYNPWRLRRNKEG